MNYLGNCASLAVGVVLPRDMVWRVQIGKNPVPEPQQLARQMASTRGVVHYLLTILLAGLMVCRVEDRVKREDDVGARVGAALRLNCPSFSRLAGGHQHIVGLEKGNFRHQSNILHISHCL